MTTTRRGLPGVRRPAAAGLAALVLAAAGPAGGEPVQYESPHVHPIDRVGNTVLVVNTPDARLSIFTRSGGALSLSREVRVGIDPITVRAKDAGTAWVVNHISDDVSIVDLATGTVIHTLLVGDEPTDVVFVDDPVEDDGSKWAVVCISQEDRLAVYDAEAPYALIASLDIPGADPRALAVHSEGNAVWVGAFESANRTTLVPRNLVADPSGPWGGTLPPFVPALNPDLPDSLMPTNGVIVRRQGGAWLDEQGGDWTSLVNWDVQDDDIVLVDISGPNPFIAKTVTDVGTLIHDLAVHPTNGDVWAVTVDALNEVLFEPKLKGEGVRNSAVRVASGGGVTTFNLNPHIVYGPPGVPNPPSPPTLRRESLTIPTEVLFVAGDGGPELMVTGIGGTRLVVLDPATGQVKRRLPVPEGATGLLALPGAAVVEPVPAPPSNAGPASAYGPSAVPAQAVVRDGDVLLVDRFTNRLHVVDPATGATGEFIPIGRSDWDPTPADVRAGRRFLYTGGHSAHGTFACASCHPSANMDGVAWDLGDPSGEMTSLVHLNSPPSFVFNYHPLKGPMVTQSLRGLKDHEPFHWRGDRMDFTRFNPAFVTLLGGDSLSTGDMLDFETFILAIEYPPNPFYDLDNQVGVFPDGGDPALGAQVFVPSCDRCHVLPSGTGDQVQFLGPVFGNQPFVVAQLKNLYEKEGMKEPAGTDNRRGFGFLHDGDRKNLDEFLAIFNLSPPDSLNLKAFLRAFPTGTDAAVGGEATLNGLASLTDGVAIGRVQQLQNAAGAGRVDLIAHGRIDGEERGFVWLSGSAGGLYQSDRTDRVWTLGELIDEVSRSQSAITFTGVPLGEGVRMGVDRDMDSYLDGDELLFGSDPADPNSVPSTTGTGGPIANHPLLTRVTGVFPAPFTDRTRVEVYLASAGPVRVQVFDVQGRTRRTLFEGELAAGGTVFPWDGRDDRGQTVAGGAYFVKLVSATATDTRKVMKLR